MAVLSQFKQKIKPKLESHRAVYLFWFAFAIFCALCLGFYFVYFRLMYRYQVAMEFEVYLKQFGKIYDDEEYEKRLQYFEESMKDIKMLNGAHSGSTGGAKFGYTKFSDMSRDEFKHLLFEIGDHENSFNRTCVSKFSKKPVSEEPLPEKKDWRAEGVVSGILDQGNCGSCWAHSVVGVMESTVQIEKLPGYKRYSNLSIQELLDCNYYKNGCKGGNPANALLFLCNERWRIVPGNAYAPLDNRQHACRLRKNPAHGVVPTDIFVEVDMNALDIARIVAFHGPVTTTVNSIPWLNYLGGIIQYHCSSERVNHVVQIVGYNMEGAVPYFIMKNSYGKDWGERGYVYVAMNGICGVGKQITYLDVAIF